MRTVHGRRQTDTSDEISLGTVARAVWRNKRAIIGPTLLIAVAAFVAVNLIAPRYKSEARVLVEGRENIFLRPEAEKTMMDRGTVDPETVTSQVQLVLSRDLAREVIKELNLAELPEFNAALKELSPLQFLRTIGILKDPMSMTLEERVLAAYYERLQAFALDKSRVISIEFQSADPELAPKVANLIAEKYLTFQQVAKQDQARSAGKWLSGELEKLRDKVSEAEGKVEAYRAKSNLFFGSGSVTLSNQQLTDLNTQVSAARAQKADSEARARLIREAVASGQPIESSDIVNSELIRRLSEQEQLRPAHQDAFEPAAIATSVIPGRRHRRAGVVDGYFARHRVKPGITGWAQINGWRGELTDADKIKGRVEHDLYYIENWSLLFDLEILLKTPRSLLKSENAY
jgi:polysaccharide biosynthesis transport protein